MSFETMRQHQKKIFLPLAIVVTVAFVFLGLGPSGGVRSLFNRGKPATIDDELIRLGQDLESASMISPPPVKWYKARVERERAHIKDAEEFQRVVRAEVSAYVRAHYRRMGAQGHYLPVKDGERLGVRITDAELSERVREIVEERWGLKPFDETAYAEECSVRSLSRARFETLVRGQMIGKRVIGILTMTAGASESEILAAYARDKQKIRVQYFQRDTKDFIGKVQILPGKRPKEEKPEDTAKAKKPDEKADETSEEKKNSNPGKIYEAEIEEKFEKRVKDLRERHKYSEDKKDFEWPTWAARQYPEFFAEPKARIEYLVALNKDFRRGIKITNKEVEEEWENNKDIKYRVKPKKSEKKAGAKDKPKVRPLDSKLKKEIREQLIKERASDAAVKALEKALKQYNDAKPEDRPKDEAGWKLFLKEHRLTRKSPEAMTQDVMEKLADLKGAMVKVSDFFDESKRKELKAKFVPHVRMEEGRGYLSFRLVNYDKRQMLSFEKARAGFTYRLKRLAAWELAEEAIEADISALKDRKLDPKRVRESILLEADSEPAEVVRNDSLAVGQASKRFVYRELLGPAAEQKKLEDEKKKEEEKDKKETSKQPKTMEERVTESLDRDLRGYRVVILVERSVPTFDDFRKDKAWRRLWKPTTPMDKALLRWQRKVPKDDQWRENFIRGYYSQKYEQLLSKAN